MIKSFIRLKDDKMYKMAKKEALIKISKKLDL